jgi:hypothetical protein
MAAAASNAAVRDVADDLLSQPQQVTQGQQQVLLFAGLFLARRQQFPLLVQVSWLLRAPSRACACSWHMIARWCLCRVASSVSQVVCHAVLTAACTVDALQDVLVRVIVEALLAAMEQMESLFGDTGSNSSLASSSGEDTTAHCCCCISAVLCIQRRLMWLQQEWKPQGGQQQQQGDAEQQYVHEQLTLLNAAVDKVSVCQLLGVRFGAAAVIEK